MSKKGDFLSGFSARQILENDSEPLCEVDSLNHPVNDSASLANAKHEQYGSHDGGKQQLPLTEQKEAPVIGDNPTESINKETTKMDVAENKRLADKIVAENEQRKAATNMANRHTQRSSAIIRPPEHVVTKDDKFHKRKIFQYSMIGVISIALIVSSIFVIQMFNSVDIPDFIGKSVTEVQTWGIASSISVETIHEYSLVVDEGEVISQSHESGTSLARGSVLSVVVSDGPDMNEVVALPADLEEMSRAEITAWRNLNGFTASSISFSDEASSEVENNHVIRIDVPNDVDISNFTRSDRLTIVFSSGPEVVQMGNFMNAPYNTREAVETWANENPSIHVEIKYETSDNIERGLVLRQSNAPNANLTEGDAVTIVFSAGSPIVVPDFSEISRAYFDDVGRELGLTINERTIYSDIAVFSSFVSQSIEPGEELFEESPSVTIVHSEGRPWIDRIEMENGIAQAIYGTDGFNNRGAAITYRVDYVNHYAPRGSVVYQSLYNQYVGLNAHINFQISLGNLERPEEVEPASGDGDNDDDIDDDNDDDDDDFDGEESDDDA